MRRNLLINCAVAALTVSFGASAWAGTGGESSQAHQNASESSSRAEGQGGHATARHGERRQRAPEGYVMIEENTVYLMANEPQQHFLQAHADLARKNYRAAAQEARMAAAYLDMQAARPGDKQANDLKQECKQLRDLAGELEGGNKNNVAVDQIDKDFARASDVLAKHFDTLTKRDLKKQNFVAAGYDLDATANAFKNTIVWSDQKPSKDDVGMIHNAKEIAFNLRSNEVYKGEQALKGEQHAWKQEGNENHAGQQQQQAQQSSNQEGQAQQANAKLPAGVTHSPLTGTTPSEARNDAQHAQKMADALEKAIDQFDSQIGQAKGQNQQSSQNKASNGNESSSTHHENSRGADQPR